MEMSRRASKLLQEHIIIGTERGFGWIGWFIHLGIIFGNVPQFESRYEQFEGAVGFGQVKLILTRSCVVIKFCKIMCL